MTRFIVLLYLIAMALLMACSEDEEENSSICPGSQLCHSTLLEEENYYPGGITVGMQGTYTATYSSYNLADVDEPFEDGDIVEFELSEDHRLTVKHDRECITLSQPFRYSQHEPRAYFLDECMFNTTFKLNRRTIPGSPVSGGIYDILDRIFVGNGFVTSYGVFCFPNEWNSCE